MPIQATSFALESESTYPGQVASHELLRLTRRVLPDLAIFISPVNVPSVLLQSPFTNPSDLERSRALAAGALDSRRTSKRRPSAENKHTILSCDIHTHTPAQISKTNIILYPFVTSILQTGLGTGHGYEWYCSNPCLSRGRRNRGIARRAEATSPS